MFDASGLFCFTVTGLAVSGWRRSRSGFGRELDRIADVFRAVGFRPAIAAFHGRLVRQGADRLGVVVGFEGAHVLLVARWLALHGHNTSFGFELFDRAHCAAYLSVQFV